MTTPATPFAAFSERVNDAVIRHLADAVALIDGVPLVGLLNTEPTDVFEHVSACRLSFTCRSGQAQAVGLVAGKTLSIAGCAYVAKQLDSANGMTVAYLKEAA